MHKSNPLVRKIFCVSMNMLALIFLCSTGGNMFASPVDSSRGDVFRLQAEHMMLQPDTGLRIDENQVRAGILYDVINHKIVWEKHLNDAFPIASLTKMMVALLTVEDVRSGKYSWDDKVEWVRSTLVGNRKNRHTIYSNVGYSLRDVFKAAMIASNNECAEQMARFIGSGNLQFTLERMNRRAYELGMFSTFYGNPTGLPAPRRVRDNASSPADQLMLTLELLKYDEVLEIAGMGYAAIDNGHSTSIIKNHNRLTIEYNGEVDGLKTGYTRKAGFCLVATTSKCEHRLVSIVLGCRGPEIRNQIVRDMFNDYYSSIGLDKLEPYCNSLSAQVPASGGTVSGEYVNIREKHKVIHVVKKGETLSGIASKYRCSVSQLRAWNRKSIRSSKLTNGQKLALYSMVTTRVFIKKPANGNEEEDDKPILTDSEQAKIRQEEKQSTALPAEPQQMTIADTSKAECSDQFVYYTVAPGDTLTSIARQYAGITVEQLKSLNKIANVNHLKPGMKIKVPFKG